MSNIAHRRSTEGMMLVDGIRQEKIGTWPLGLGDSVQQHDNHVLLRNTHKAHKAYEAEKHHIRTLCRIGDEFVEVA